MMVAGLGLALASCGHSSKETHTTTGTAKAAPASAAASTSAPATSGGASLSTDVKAPSTKGYPLTAKGLGVVAVGAAAPSQVSLTGTVKETTFMTGPAPITFEGKGNPAIQGTIMTSSRSNQIDSSTRFLMSDQSASSKDAPTAFGILVDHSKVGQFAAGAYYGGKTATNIPTSGTATYKGNYAGSLSNGAVAENSKLGASGDLALTTDFAAGKIQGDISNIQSATAGQPTKLKFSSTMSGDKASYATGQGDTISATVAGVDKVVPGKVEGGFFGVGASETAGAITTTDAGASTVGAFYGKKQ